MINDPVNASAAVRVLTENSFGINQHWAQLVISLGVSNDDLVGLQRKSITCDIVAVLMEGIDLGTKSRILTWREFIDIVSRIEPVTGNKIAEYFGIVL